MEIYKQNNFLYKQKNFCIHILTHYKNYKFPAANSTSFIYALYRVVTIVKKL